MTVGVLLLSYALVFVGKLEAKQWFDSALIAAGIYTVGNVATKLANR